MSTAGEESWWDAMVAAAQFEDGSLDIQNDSLSVNGGGTVNLLVKLGAEPSADVTVALSEASALISLGVASLTFTPDNWDTFQSVTVTAGGNRQTLQLPGAQFSNPSPDAGNESALWSALNLNIDAGLRSGTIVQLVSAELRRGNGGQISLDFSGGELSSAFETSGSVTMEAAGQTETFDIGGLDTSEPYIYTLGTDVTDFMDAIGLDSSVAQTNIAATLTLRDYVPGDATVSLSASGPSEYSGVTGSATVTVN